ncbi:lysozyme inhibitor LprI family protein [Eleftheria terrae]|uniref:lysozyme inhibitor LprI family protein n=1 Tax=Eleftheria terrae TaxID=1597781 RepID=UPI00263BD7A8|nr:lysozyme inhibitor LprI family protein [Eleftheria terrae]WKB56018.1 lysozyme inhibitor LprI family protein [Eleftheria terrae]
MKTIMCNVAGGFCLSGAVMTVKAVPLHSACHAVRLAIGAVASLVAGGVLAADVCQGVDLPAFDDACLRQRVQEREAVVVHLTRDLEQSMDGRLREAVSAADRSWREFRRRQCALEWLYAYPGSMSESDQQRCLLRLADSRIAELKAGLARAPELRR